MNSNKARNGIKEVRCIENEAEDSILSSALVSQVSILD